MMFFKPIKYILFLLCLCAFVKSSLAQDFSYVYIQGDKETPFYVKFEGEMLPRYGKNYIIIPMLAPGPINIEILFQQNKFPAQKFVIQVPENGFRAFMISKKAGTFSLYDFHQKYYIHPGNKAIDDKAPDNNPNNKFLNTSNTAIKNTTSTQPVAIPTQKTVTTTPTNGSSPKFIADIQINSGNADAPQPATSITPPVQKTTDYRTNTKAAVIKDNAPPQTTPQPATTKPNTIVGAAIINSDCPTALSNSEFEGIYKKALDKSEKIRLKYLLSEMGLCYSTSQARSLALTLSNDPEKYTLLKRIYPRVTDQAQFPTLENLLSTNEWKDYFKLILPE